MELRDRRVLVTGGAGFVGGNLVRRLLREGAEVTVLDDLFTGSRENLPPTGFTFVEGSVCDPPTVEHLVAQNPIVFHCRGAEHRRLHAQSARGFRDQHRRHAQRAAGGARRRNRASRLHLLHLGLRQSALSPDQRGRSRCRCSRPTRCPSWPASTTAPPSTSPTTCRPWRCVTRTSMGQARTPPTPIAAWWPSSSRRCSPAGRR